MKKIILMFCLVFLVGAEARGNSSTAYGKYSGLKQKMKCSQDKKTYGTFKDSGYWKGGAWCGERGKAGYWVYAYPYWYVWRSKVDKTSAYGKYRGLKQKMKCSQDRTKYGNYKDSGYWKGGPWCGERGKAGYWVYAYPNWYVWRYRN